MRKDINRNQDNQKRKDMKYKSEEIVEETPREAIVNRPHNLAGSVQRVIRERFSITFDKVEYKETNIVPAVIKLFQEALDNPVDVAIKSNFECGNKIDIKVTKDTIFVKDNGFGIPSQRDDKGQYPAFKAFCLYNTSSNYKRDNDGQKGVNGIGIKLCSTLSTYLLAISDDGKMRVKVEATNNNAEHAVSAEKSKGRGTEVTFKPDFRIFEIDELDEEHISRMYEYTLIQALTYPEVNFTFNEKSVKYTNKKFLSLFGKEFVHHETENYFVAVMSNESDDFKQISFVNGLETQRGGSHIDYIANGIIGEIREKLIKKYKTIKPGDIKNKLQIVMVARNFKGLKWDGQTKESITNPTKDMAEYFSDIDFKKLSEKILKTPEIIDPITEVYKIKEELKRRQELKGLEKTVKKIKSDKYLPSIGVKKYLMLCEGACLEENTKVMLSDYSHKAIKDIEVGDNIISGDLSTQTVKSKVKLMKEALSIKTASGIIVCGVGHKLKALDTQTNEFIFIEASKLKEDKDRYKLLKAKINSNTNGLKVIGNDVINHILELDNGVVQYTPNDYFVVVRDEIIVRLYSEEVACGDLLILS